MKKLMLGVFMSVMAVFGLSTITPVNAQAGSNIPTSWDQTTNNTAVQGGINVAGGTDTDQGDRIIQVVKNLINYVLGFLGLIALVMLLFGGFKIVTGGEDEWKVASGFKILKNAAFGIWFIGLAWFLVTFIFFVFWLITN